MREEKRKSSVHSYSCKFMIFEFQIGKEHLYKRYQFNMFKGLLRYFDKVFPELFTGKDERQS